MPVHYSCSREQGSAFHQHACDAPLSIGQRCLVDVKIGFGAICLPQWETTEGDWVTDGVRSEPGRTLG